MGPTLNDIAERREEAEIEAKMAHNPVASANASAARRVLLTTRRSLRQRPGSGEFSTDSTSPLSAASPSEVVMMAQRN
eukprot:12134461-Karenia_brevis.AAC.1